ncbi:serine hydrolase domain-containing protein [Microbacterium paraoxydans]|uniref:Beta-lactamase n=1 Tax=Microbacterium paraoxydans TaxID=199592 RepID=A0ABS5IL11_9MICO|nr:serine hydrolase domain-containing protein [Microbacterium paraoxydans]MBS0023648.1 beta-lactamase family protein [Microbacterium paraoxydans]
MRRSEGFGDAAAELARLAGTAGAGVAAALRDGDGEWTQLGYPVEAAQRRFEIGSVSKALTGSLFGVLIAAGEVDPEQPIDEARDERLPWRGTAPTLLDLATHRAGLPNTPRPLVRRELATALGFSVKDPWRGVSDDDYRRLLSASAARARRDGRFRYSSMGVGLLGDALAAVTGVPFAELMRERLLGPLGMTRTGLDRPTAGPDVVERPTNGKGVALPYLQDAMPAAGMYASTLDDLQRLADALLGPAPAEVAEGLRLAVTPHHRIKDDLQLGLCWFLVGPGSAPVIEHTGGTWGSQAQFTVQPSTGRAVVALTATPRRIDSFAARYLAAGAPAVESRAHGTAEAHTPEPPDATAASPRTP